MHCNSMYCKLESTFLQIISYGLTLLQFYALKFCKLYEVDVINS
jgi:hypothetical protein